MTRYELTAAKHTRPTTRALRRKPFTAAHFRRLPQLSADSALRVTGFRAWRTHHPPYARPRNATRTLSSERMSPRISAESTYREEP